MKSPKPRKACQLTMRLTQATRDRLGAAAQREGRSVSEVAARWLDSASEPGTKVEAVTTAGDTLPSWQLPTLPRAGDTLEHPERPGLLWRVLGAHWPATGPAVLQVAPIQGGASA